MIQNNKQSQVLVVPCSGMGKVHGLISREAANHVTDTLMPGQSEHCRNRMKSLVVIK